MESKDFASSDFGNDMVAATNIINKLEEQDNKTKAEQEQPKTKKKTKPKQEDIALQILESKKRSKRVQLVLYPFLYEQAKKIADKKHISFNKLIELLLFDAVQKEKS